MASDQIAWFPPPLGMGGVLPCIPVKGADYGWGVVIAPCTAPSRGPTPPGPG